MNRYWLYSLVQTVISTEYFILQPFDSVIYCSYDLLRSLIYPSYTICIVVVIGIIVIAVGSPYIKEGI